MAKTQTNRLLGRLLFTLIALVLANGISAQETPLVLKNATIHPMDGNEAFTGSILIVDGKIKNVGKKVKAPKKAKVIDLKGYQITPGLIDCRSKLWITESSLKDTGSKADVDIELGIDPWQDSWKDLASQGITSVYVQPASGGLMGGYGSWLNVGPFEATDAIIMRSKTGLQCSLGLSGNSKTRADQVKSLEKLLETAKKELDKEKDADKPPKPRTKDKKDEKGKEDKSEEKKDDKKDDDKDDKKKDAAKDGKKDDAKKDDDKKDDEKKKDPLKIALRKLLKRELPLSIEVHHPDTLSAVLKLVTKYKLRVTLDGLSKIGSANAEMSKSNLPIVVGPLAEATTPPAYRKNASFDWLANYANQGRLWSLSGFPTTAVQSRSLRYQAAVAVRHGVTRSAALAALTVNPARMFGVSDQVGTIEAGKIANLAVFAGAPTDPATPVRMVICQGKITHDVEHPPVKMVSDGGTDETMTPLPKRLPETYAIRSTRVMDKDGKYSAGTFIVEKGRITKIDQKPGKQTPVFDLGDMVVTPGLTNAWSTLNQNATVWDSTESDMSHVRAIDGIDPDTKTTREFLAAGVIHVGIAPTTQSTASGMMGHLRLGSGDYVADPASAGQFVLSSSGRNANRFPASLGSQVTMVNNLLVAKLGKSKFYLPGTLADALAAEKRSNLRKVRRGECPCILLASQAGEIQHAIRLPEKFLLKPVLASSADLRPFIDSLAEAKFDVIVLENRDVMDEMIQQYVLLDSKGVSIAISASTTEGVRLTASMLANAGMPKENARIAMTTSGAEVIGMKPTSLSTGNPADFVVWDGDPLDMASKPIHVLVDGKTVTQ